MGRERDTEVLGCVGVKDMAKDSQIVTRSRDYVCDELKRRTDRQTDRQRDRQTERV